MATNPQTALLKKWRHWLDRIFHDQLADLLVSRNHFLELQDCVRRHQGARLHQGNSGGAELSRWMVQGHLAVAITAIRRIVERPSKYSSISLMILLQDVLANHSSLTVERHRTMYRRAFPRDRWHVADDAAERAFAEITGSTRATIMPAARIERDIKALGRASKVVKRYANKVIAHTEHDRRRIGKLKHADIGTAIEKIEELFKRYSYLINGRCSNPLIPSEDLDITADLQKVWPS